MAKELWDNEGMKHSDMIVYIGFTVEKSEIMITVIICITVNKIVVSRTTSYSTYSLGIKCSKSLRISKKSNNSHTSNSIHIPTMGISSHYSV